MDIDIFRRIANKAYQTLDGAGYTLDEALSVFEYYFARYEQVFSEPHPNIRTEQVADLIKRMPCLLDYRDMTTDIMPEDYPVLIDQHFQTQYRSDYNINHFFSGDIRTMRFYETLY